MSANKVRKLNDGSKERIILETQNSDIDICTNDQDLSELILNQSNLDFTLNEDENQTNNETCVENLNKSSNLSLNSSLEENNYYGECGTIESIALYNFMCHDHFEINFSPRVNFVIGKNGSGKSSILNAIVIVFGGRASNTGRGQNLAGFIKKGQNSAKIIIKLCNFNNYSTVSSYNLNEYGKSIIIERIIKTEGCGSYLIKSATGKIISKKKEDLNDIIRHFSIQIENPVCILSQEVSKNFLNSKNPRDKYNFFMKATNLEQLKQDYAFAMEQSEIATHILEKKKNCLPKIAIEVNKLEQQVALFQQFNQNKEKLTILTSELLWSVVRDLENDKIAQEKNIEEINKKIIKLKESIVDQNKKIENLHETKNNATTTIENYEKELNNLKTSKDEAKTEFEKLDNLKNSMTLEIDNLKIEIFSLEKDKNKLQKKIEEIKKQIEQQEKLQCEKNEINELKKKSESLKEQIKFLDLNKNKIFSDLNIKQEELRNINQTISRTKSIIYEKHNYLSNLKNSQKDSLLRYGNYMPTLLKKIEQEYIKGNFKKKPVGPIGCHIKVKNNNVALALECCLKNLLLAFCCDNSEDVKLLRSILINLKISPLPVIYKRKFRSKYNLKDNIIETEKFKSFLAHIIVDNDQAYNLLLDKKSIENILFFLKDEDAIKHLSNEEDVPKNCKEAYSKNGTLFYPQKENSFFRQYTNNFYKTVRYLTNNVSLSIEITEKEIEESKKIVKINEQEKLKFEKEQIELNENLKKGNIETKKLQTELTDIFKILFEKDNIAEFKPEEIAFFESDLETCINNLNELKNKIDIKKQEYQKLQEKRKEREKCYIELRNEIMNKKNELDKILRDNQNSESTINTIKQEIIKINERLDEFGLRQEANSNKLKKILENIEFATLTAQNNNANRIETNRSNDEIKKEIIDIEAFIKESEKQIGNREEIFALYKERNQHYEKIKEQINFLEKYLENFFSTIKSRSRIYISYRAFVTDRTSRLFSNALKMMNFTGTLNIYHKRVIINDEEKKEKTLEIKLNPKSSDTNKAYSDTKSLSGGERSFATIAFLLALWDSSYSPFNVLDEIDVFMDMVTRHLTLDALIVSANKKCGKQYIFLSPLPPEKKNISELLTIFYMPEPKRID